MWLPSKGDTSSILIQLFLLVLITSLNHKDDNVQTNNNSNYFLLLTD